MLKEYCEAIGCHEPATCRLMIEGEVFAYVCSAHAHETSNVLERDSNEAAIMKRRCVDCRLVFATKHKEEKLCPECRREERGHQLMAGQTD